MWSAPPLLAIRRRLPTFRLSRNWQTAVHGYGPDALYRTCLMLQLRHAGFGSFVALATEEAQARAAVTQDVQQQCTPIYCRALTDIEMGWRSSIAAAEVAVRCAHGLQVCAVTRAVSPERSPRGRPGPRIGIGSSRVSSFAQARRFLVDGNGFLPRKTVQCVCRRLAQIRCRLSVGPQPPSSVSPRPPVVGPHLPSVGRHWPLLDAN